MTVPTLPPFYDMKMTREDGSLTPDGFLYNDQLFQALNLAVILLNNAITSMIDANGSIINQGVVFPSYTTAQITALVPNATVGTVWFNTTLAKLQVLTAPATVETVTST